MPNVTAPHDCTFRTIAGGNSTFFRVVAVPLSASLESELPKHGIPLNDGLADDILTIDERPKAVGGAIAGIAGVVLFFGSWAAKKALDEIYAKIRPKIVDVFSRSDEELKSIERKKLYQVGIWYGDKRVFILVTFVANSFAEILTHERLLPTIHANAVNWITQNGSHKCVHLYLVEDGRSNVAPLEFDNWFRAQGYIENQWPASPPQRPSIAN
jgi:hypothetical protein